MDNLTHTIAGLWAGELAYQTASRLSENEKPMPGRGWFWFIGAAANNFPDLDLVLYRQLPDPLGYLLHHRGHTHTLGGAIFEAILVFALCILFSGFRELWRSSKANRIALVSLSFIGLLMHITFDSFNSYGVHPFYPFSGKWFYGDLLFIIEPMMWVIFGVPFALSLQQKWSKLAWLAFVLITPIAFAANQLMPWTSTALMWLVTGFYFLFRHNKANLMRASLGVFAIYIFSQFALSKFANTKLSEIANGQFHGEKILENSISPLPANPLCWQFVSVSVKDNSDEVILRRGNLTLAPKLYVPEYCQLKARNADLGSQPIAATKDVVWYRDHHDSISGFQAQAKNCHTHAWLRFARMPAFTEKAASDWRYVGQGDENFTTMRFDEMKDFECPRWVPQWIPPRLDLIEMSTASY